AHNSTIQKTENHRKKEYFQEFAVNKTIRNEASRCKRMSSCPKPSNPQEEATNRKTPSGEYKQ
ncbi:hypothetical protein NDU88_002084, partial [Pleurodeles waltl]